MSEQRAPYYFWSNPNSLIRVIEGAGAIRSHIIENTPQPSATFLGLEVVFDCAAFADSVMELAGKEMSVADLVKAISLRLVASGWVERGVNIVAVDLAKDMVEMREK